MPVLGAATLELNADTGKLEADLGRTVANASAFGAALGTAIGQGVSAALRSLRDLTANAIDSLDAYDKLGQKLSVNVARLSEYRVAAALAGTSDAALRSGMKELAIHSAEAAKGTGQAAEAFKAMGLAPAQFKSTADLFDAVLAKLAAYEEGANRDALANATLGRSYQELMPLAEQLQKNQHLARELGLELDQNTTQAAARFKDNLKIAELGLTAIGTKIAVVLLPTLEQFSKYLVDNAKDTSRLDMVARTAEAGLKILATAATVTGAVFDYVGSGIGRAAAVVAAVARRDFKGAFDLVVDSGTDASEKIRSAVASVETIWDETAKKVEAKADETGKKIAAPSLAAAREVAKATKTMWEQVFKAIDDEREADNERARQTAAETAEIDAKAAADKQKMWQQVFKNIDDQQEREDEAARTAAGIGEATKKTNDIARDLGMVFSSSFEDAIVTGKRLQDVLQGLAQDIERILIRKLVTEPLADSLTGMIKDASGGGGVGAFFSRLFGGGADSGAPVQLGGPRAGGGSVASGVAYLVGEKGPELFVPDVAGTVVPNEAMGGSRSVVINMNVTTPDASSFRASSAQIAADLQRAARRAFA